MNASRTTAAAPTGEPASGALERAIDLLHHLHRVGRPCGVSELGRDLGWPKSSVHRLLATLHARDWVERDGRGHYRPGFGLVALGLGALGGEPLVQAARPVIEAQSEALAETLFVVSDRAGRLVVLDKVEGPGFLRAAPRIGAEVPAHATAVGILYLAHAPERLAPLGPNPERFTPRTRVSASARSRAVREASERGWAENREEWIPGLSVVAAPVLVDGDLRGAVALAAATPRLEQIGTRQAGRSVMEAADQVATRLSGRTR